MINFFRAIRKKLLTENQLTRYLLYAAGEIILVVIGIMLALYINNKNEQHKNEIKVDLILKEIQKELAKDIKKANNTIDYYHQKDSTISLFLRNKFTYDYYKDLKNFRSFYLIANYNDLKIHDNAYQTLMRNIDKIPERYNEVLNLLNNLYVYDWVAAENDFERLKRLLTEHWTSWLILKFGFLNLRWDVLMMKLLIIF